MQTQTEQPVIITDWLSGFQAFLENDYKRWSPNRHRPGLKTVKAALQHIRVFSLWWEATYRETFEPSMLTGIDLHAYRKHSLDEARVSADTWNARLWALRIFCAYAGHPELAEDLEAKKRGFKPGRYRSLTQQEYGYLVHTLELRIRRSTTLFENQSKVRDRAAVSLMLYAGLRVEEVSLLDLDDITINERSGSILIRNGKGDKERIVPLNLPVRKALSAWLAIIPLTTSSATAKALFVGKRSERLTTRQHERIVSQIGTESRIPGLTPHWLRFTFAKRLEVKGASIEQIRDLLGHSSIEITRRYLAAGFDELQSLVETF
jgi:site-specific recombinase XerD